MSLLYIQLGIYFVCVIGLFIYYQLNCQSVVDLNFLFRFMFLLFYTLLEDDGAGCSRDTFRSIISEGFFRSIGMLLNLNTSLLREAFKF